MASQPRRKYRSKAYLLSLIFNQARPRTSAVAHDYLWGQGTSNEPEDTDKINVDNTAKSCSKSDVYYLNIRHNLNKMAIIYVMYLVWETIRWTEQLLIVCDAYLGGNRECHLIHWPFSEWR